MPAITFDTNVFISRRGRNDELITRANVYLSAVVLQELLVGAADQSEVKALAGVRSYYQKLDRLLVPDEEDWWQVGRITNDVLIARTAHRVGATVVTDNVRDFEAIQPFCNVRVLTASEYFGG